jgi:hypothetical protein
MKRNVQPVPPYLFSYPGAIAMYYETRHELVSSGGKAGDHPEEETDYNITVYKDEQVINWLVLSPVDKDTACLHTKYVDEGGDCEKLETRLLGGVASLAKEKGFHRLEVCPCLISLGFFKQMGYKEEGDQFRDAAVRRQKVFKLL